MDLVVADQADLNALRTRDRSAVRRIRLAGPLTDERLERDLNRAYFACGCGAGSISVSLTLSACLLLGLLRGFEAELAWWRILLYLVAASISGKLAGLLLARIRLHRLLCRLSADARDKTPGSIQAMSESPEPIQPFVLSNFRTAVPVSTYAGNTLQETHGTKGL